MVLALFNPSTRPTTFAAHARFLGIGSKVTKDVPSAIHQKAKKSIVGSLSKNSACYTICTLIDSGFIKKNGFQSNKIKIPLCQ